MTPTAPRSVIVVALPCAQLLDVAGPMDVFAEANRQAGGNAYQLRLLATEAGHILTSSGVRLIADGITRGKAASIDTLLVVGSPTAADHALPKSTLSWLVDASSQARRYGSVCTGAFALAAAGLLDGRKVATHWAFAERLMRDYPQVDVDIDAIHVRDGALCSAAGVTAGLDLALALIGEDLGPAIAKRVAANLVMFFRRPSGQAQFTRDGEVDASAHTSFQGLLRWVIAHPGAGHSVASMAGRLNLSPRHFTRVFRAEMGVNPGTWLEEVRLAEARRLLQSANGAPKRVAAACGYADANSLRRSFQRAFGTTPAQFRRAFTRGP